MLTDLTNLIGEEPENLETHRSLGMTRRMAQFPTNNVADCLFLSENLDSHSCFRNVQAWDIGSTAAFNELTLTNLVDAVSGQVCRKQYRTVVAIQRVPGRFLVRF
jgi:hypothetical protein